METKLTLERIEAYREYLKLALPAARTLAVREEIDALCNMARRAEEMCEQLEQLEGLANTGLGSARLHKAIGAVRICITRFRSMEKL